MAVNEKQFEAKKPYQKPDVLRAKDIIPGAGHSEIENEAGSNIPRFDLAQDIMAEHRRLTATRRKSPPSTAERVSRVENLELRAELAAQNIEFDSYAQHPLLDWDPIIADIVTRDIESFCSGGVQ